MVDNRVYALPAGVTHLVQTVFDHTAFNGGNNKRYNLLISTVPTEEQKRQFIESYTE